MRLVRELLGAHDARTSPEQAQRDQHRYTRRGIARFAQPARQVGAQVLQQLGRLLHESVEQLGVDRAQLAPGASS